MRPRKHDNRSILFLRLGLGLALVATLIVVTIKPSRTVQAAAIGAGHLIVYRVTDSTTSNAVAVFLDEYDLSGALIQSIPMPTAVAGLNRILTASGSSTSEGLLTRSADGRYIVLAGYDAPVATAGVTTSVPATINRIIGRVDSLGNVDTTTALNDPTGNPRSATSTDGTTLWLTSSSNGLRSTTLGTVGPTVQVSTTVTNLRQANIFAGQLYVSDNSGSAVRLGTVGVGTPTATGQTITNLPGFPTTGSPYNYFFADLTGTVAGLDTLYVAEDTAGGGQVQKFSLVGGSWVVNGTMAFPSVRGLTGFVPFGTSNVSLFGTSPAILGLLVDTAGYNVAPNGGLSTLAAPTGTNAFRGVAFSPFIPTAANGAVSGRITDTNGAPIAGAVVRMSGSQTRKTITDANGNYHFDNVETNGFYTVTPSSANFSFSPGGRSFSQLGNSTEATFTGSPIASLNPLDTPEYFVRQHYLDFLGREPDEAGFNFWSNQILGCGNDADCFERRTVNVSAAYFLSTEFQQTGGLVDRFYKASYGRSPLYAEFMPDTAAISRDVVVGRTGWDDHLTANREAFVAGWVERAAFRSAFDSLSNDNYVDALVSNTGVSFTPTERAALVNGLSNATLSRAEVLEQIANNENFARARFNEAFVMMEYFGYLRRDPDASGYQFWLDKLNQFDGNFERADMVKAFIVSGEYRARFGH